MPKLLPTIVTCLLIPCLLIDPATASAMGFPGRANIQASLFDGQALAETAVTAHQLISSGKDWAIGHLLRLDTRGFIGKGYDIDSAALFGPTMTEQDRQFTLFEDAPVQESPDWEPLRFALVCITFLTTYNAVSGIVLTHILKAGLEASFQRVYRRHAQPDKNGKPMGKLLIRKQWVPYVPALHDQLLRLFHDFIAFHIMSAYFTALEGEGSLEERVNAAFEAAYWVSIGAHEAWNRHNYLNGFVGMAADQNVPLISAIAAVLAWIFYERDGFSVRISFHENHSPMPDELIAPFTELDRLAHSDLANSANEQHFEEILARLKQYQDRSAGHGAGKKRFPKGFIPFRKLQDLMSHNFAFAIKYQAPCADLFEGFSDDYMLVPASVMNIRDAWIGGQSPAAEDVEKVKFNSRPEQLGEIARLLGDLGHNALVGKVLGRIMFVRRSDRFFAGIQNATLRPLAIEERDHLIVLHRKEVKHRLLVAALIGVLAALAWFGVHHVWMAMAIMKIPGGRNIDIPEPTILHPLPPGLARAQEDGSQSFHPALMELRRLFGHGAETIIQTWDALYSETYPETDTGYYQKILAHLAVIEPVVAHPEASLNLLRFMVERQLREAWLLLGVLQHDFLSERGEVVKWMDDAQHRFAERTHPMGMSNGHSHILPQGFVLTLNNSHIVVHTEAGEWELTIDRVSRQKPLLIQEVTAWGLDHPNASLCNAATDSEAIGYMVHDPSRTDPLVAYSLAFPRLAMKDPQAAEPDALYLTSFTTLWTYQNLGIRLALIRETIREARARGYKTLYALVKTGIGHRAPIRSKEAEVLLNSLGFEKTGLPPGIPRDEIDFHTNEQWFRLDLARIPALASAHGTPTATRARQTLRMRHFMPLLRALWSLLWKLSPAQVAALEVGPLLQRLERAIQKRLAIFLDVHLDSPDSEQLSKDYRRLVRALIRTAFKTYRRLYTGPASLGLAISTSNQKARFAVEKEHEKINAQS